MKALRILLKIFSALILIVSILIGILIIRPEWILTPNVLSSLVQKFASSSQPSWNNLQIKITSKTWKKKEISIEAENLCIKNDRVNGCLSKLEAVSLWSWPYPIRPISFQKLIAVSDNIKIIDPSPSSEQKTTTLNSLSLPKSELIQRIVKLLRPTQWSELKIFVEKLEWDRDIYLIHVSRTANPKPVIEFSVQRNSMFVLKGRWQEDNLGRPILNANLEGPNQVFRLELQPHPSQNNRLSLNFQGSLRKKRISLESVLDIEIKPSSLFLSGILKANWNRTRIETHISSFQIDIDPKTSIFSKIHVSAESEIQTAGKWAKFLIFDVQAGYNFLTSQLNLEIKNRDPLVRAHLHANCKIYLPVQSINECEVPPELLISVPHSLVVDLLHGSSFAIFAPFHVLKGPIQLRVISEKSLNEWKVSLHTDLQSPHQKLNVDLSGILSEVNSTNPLLKLDLKLKKVELQLPKIDPTNIPNLQWDSRIQREGRAQPPKLSEVKSLRFQMRIRTDDPLLLRTNLAVDAIPVILDYHITNQNRTGTVFTRPFTIQIFRRQALVKKLRLTSVSDSNLSEIDGLIEYKTSEATIDIHLTGQTSKPNIHFTSDPPLSQSEIISLILFGRTSLGTGEAATVGNANAAFTSGAFGLASLYLFASTPIESIGYNPVTHTYSVRVRLPGGISAEYGSGLDEDSEQHLSFRKQLGSHFMLSTEWENFTDEQGQSVNTFLQWFMRF